MHGTIDHARTITIYSPPLRVQTQRTASACAPEGAICAPIRTLPSEDGPIAVRCRPRMVQLPCETSTNQNTACLCPFVFALFAV
jgi:hypothetical protein